MSETKIQELKTIKHEEEQIRQKERDIEHEMKRVEKAEEKITRQEREILEAERLILKDLNEHPVKIIRRDGVTAKEIGYLRKLYLRKFARHKVVYTLTITFAVVLVWRGLWNTVDLIPFLSYSFISLIVGILILWAINHFADVA